MSRAGFLRQRRILNSGSSALTINNQWPQHSGVCLHLFLTADCRPLSQLHVQELEIGRGRSVFSTEVGRYHKPAHFFFFFFPGGSVVEVFEGGEVGKESMDELLGRLFLG